MKRAGPNSIYPSSSAGWTGRSNLKTKATMAWRCPAGLRVLVALQQGLNPRIMAAGAKVVNWLYVIARAVDDGAGRCFPKFVSRKLFLTAFKFDHLIAKISYLLTKRYIRFARAYYLLSQTSNGFADLVHWRRLRRLKQRLESVNRTYGRIERRGPLPCDVDCLLRGVYVEIHEIASASKENAEYRRKSATNRGEAQDLSRGCNWLCHWLRASFAGWRK